MAKADVKDADAFRAALKTADFKSILFKKIKKWLKRGKNYLLNIGERENQDLEGSGEKGKDYLMKIGKKKNIIC